MRCCRRRRSRRISPNPRNPYVPPEFSKQFLKCLSILDVTLGAVADMQWANTEMAATASKGDVKAFLDASEDYDDAARDDNRAAGRYSDNGCLGIAGPGPLPQPPAKWPNT